MNAEDLGLSGRRSPAATPPASSVIPRELALDARQREVDARDVGAVVGDHALLLTAALCWDLRGYHFPQPCERKDRDEVMKDCATILMEICR